MAGSGSEYFFVEWKEQYVSKERGNRVVHYFLKDNSGESILAVVGTERSVRHMFYVVSDEFLSVHGAENSVHAGFRWRSRREVVNWLTSMLSKQHRHGDYSMSPKDDPSSEVNAQQVQLSSHKGHLARNLNGHHLDISWSGKAWICGKQLKHYPAFCRNGISIAVQSFVFVMAEKENHYVAYLEDMYEDRKCQKKVKVRWFHHNREVKGVVSLRNPHPKEVFITPYVQVISAECVDGPAIVLTREHYDKCLAVFPHDLLGRVHFCFRQFKSSRVKPFKLSKLRGYFDQPIFSCFSPDFFEEEDFSTEDDAKVGAKRSRSSRDNQKMTYDLSYHKKLKYGLLSREPKNHTPTITVNDKVEFLCQDSGIRGCWFRCTVLEVSKRQMKILYDDIKDEDTCINLEESVPTYRVAKADKLGMRHFGRPTIRPAYTNDEKTNLVFEVGDPADAWWNDGWWEGVITRDNKDGTYQIYFPGENLYADIEPKNLRTSKDWVGDRWVDIEPNSNILSVISALDISAVSKETKSDIIPSTYHKVVTSNKLSTVEEELHNLEGMTLTNVPLSDDPSYAQQQQILEAEDKDYYSEDEENEDFDHIGTNSVKCTLLTGDGDDDDDDDDNEDNDDKVNQNDKHGEPEADDQKCEAEPMEVLTKC